MAFIRVIRVVHFVVVLFLINVTAYNYSLHEVEEESHYRGPGQCSPLLPV